MAGEMFSQKTGIILQVSLDWWNCRLRRDQQVCYPIGYCGTKGGFTSHSDTPAYSDD